MKLIEISKKDKDDTRTGGTYAGYRFDKNDLKKITDWAEENKIPNLIPSNKIHCTLLYSKKPCPNYKPLGKLKKPFVVKLGKMEVWPTQDKKYALIINLDAPEMIERHKQLMDELNATYDYDEYKPHITISYDVGKDFKLKNKPKLEGSIKVVEEYDEQLIDDWQNNS